MEDTVRVIRVLVYQGDRSWVEKTLATGAVPANGRHVLGTGDIISSMTISEFPEVVSPVEQQIKEAYELGLIVQTPPFKKIG